MDFQIAVDWLIKNIEGTTFTNAPLDHGGPTRYGIIQSEYDAYRVSQGLSIKSVADIGMDEVYYIYGHNYYIPSGAPKMPDAMRFVIFQSAVQFNVAPAVRLLQEVVGVMPDGIFGPATEAATNSYVAAHGDGSLVDAYLAAQLERYAAIVARTPDQAVWYDGWVNRVAKTKAYVANLITGAGTAAAGAGVVYLALTAVGIAMLARARRRNDKSK